MGDSYDDAEVAGVLDSTYCQKHKAGKGLWPHECPDCIKASKAKRARNRVNWKKRETSAAIGMPHPDLFEGVENVTMTLGNKTVAIK